SQGNAASLFDRNQKLCGPQIAAEGSEALRFCEMAARYRLCTNRVGSAVVTRRVLFLTEINMKRNGLIALSASLYLFAAPLCGAAEPAMLSNGQLVTHE